MVEIKNITLEFACNEKLSDKLFCDKCSHNVIDFTSKTTEELQKEIDKSLRPVCGIFKTSQLSEHFLKYAAATVIATSFAIPTLAQGTVRLDSTDSLLMTCERIEVENEQEVFLGLVIEAQAEPVGGYKKFFDAITEKLIYPKRLSEKGKVFVEFTVDTVGQMKDVRLIKGFNKAADEEAIRVLTLLKFPFIPGRQGGTPAKTRLIVPILFDPNERQKR